MIRAFLSRRRKGAMAMVAVAAMVPTTAMLTSNLNTSQMVDDRRTVQDGADALAMMHGTWTARSLNIIAMNNVTTAQLLTVAVGSEALVATAVQLIATAGLTEGYILGHAGIHCTPRNLAEAILWTGPCTTWHTMVALPALLAQSRAGSILENFRPVHGVRTASKALRAIDGMNHALLARHPRAMSEIGQRYARDLGLNDFHFADPCNGFGVQNCTTRNTDDGMALPLEDGGFPEYALLYGLMRTGTIGVHTTFDARGFGFNEGPIRHGGSSRNPHVRDHINQITGIGNALNHFQNFYSSRISDLPRRIDSGPGNSFGPRNTQRRQRGRGIQRPTASGLGSVLNFTVRIQEIADTFNRIALNIAQFIPIIQKDRIPQFVRLLPARQDTNGPNSYTLAFDAAYLTVMAPAVRNNSAGLLAPVPTQYRLAGMNSVTSVLTANPYDMPDPFHVLAFGLRDKSPRLSESVMGTSVQSHTGYGQVGVFNPDGASLFSQNWQARLMPATRMDNPRQAGADLNRQAHSSFDTLADSISAVTDTATWGRVHAH